MVRDRKVTSNRQWLGFEFGLGKGKSFTEATLELTHSGRDALGHHGERTSMISLQETREVEDSSVVSLSYWLRSACLLAKW